MSLFSTYFIGLLKGSQKSRECFSTPERGESLSAHLHQPCHVAHRSPDHLGSCSQLEHKHMYSERRLDWEARWKKSQVLDHSWWFYLALETHWLSLGNYIRMWSNHPKLNTVPLPPMRTQLRRELKDPVRWVIRKSFWEDTGEEVVKHGNGKKKRQKWIITQYRKSEYRTTHQAVLKKKKRERKKKKKKKWKL